MGISFPRFPVMRGVGEAAFSRDAVNPSLGARPQPSWLRNAREKTASPTPLRSQLVAIC